MSLNNLPILSTKNLTSSKTIKNVAIAVPVAAVVVWLAPWWLIAGAVGAAGYGVYKTVVKS